MNTFDVIQQRSLISKFLHYSIAESSNSNNDYQLPNKMLPSPPSLVCISYSCYYIRLFYYKKNSLFQNLLMFFKIFFLYDKLIVKIIQRILNFFIFFNIFTFLYENLHFLFYILKLNIFQSTNFVT